MSINPVDQRVHVLERQMERSIKSWDSKYSGVTLGEMSRNIETWLRDTEILEYDPSTQSQQLQAAKSALKSAWENRDNKGEMLQGTKKAYHAIKSLNNLKGGDPASLAGRYSDASPVQRDVMEALDNAIFTIKGLYAAKSQSHHLAEDQASLVEDRINSIKSVYIENSKVRNLCDAIIESVQAGVNYQDSSIKSYASQMYSDALKSAQRLVHHFERAYLPEDHVPTVNERQMVLIEKKLDEIDNNFSNASFKHPMDSIMSSIKCLQEIRRITSSTDAYTFNRKIDAAIEIGRAALGAVGSPTIKALDGRISARQLWAEPLISDNVDLFISKIKEAVDEL